MFTSKISVIEPGLLNIEGYGTLLLKLITSISYTNKNKTGNLEYSFTISMKDADDVRIGGDWTQLSFLVQLRREIVANWAQWRKDMIATNKAEWAAERARSRAQFEKRQAERVAAREAARSVTYSTVGYEILQDKLAAGRPATSDGLPRRYSLGYFRSNAAWSPSCLGRRFHIVSPLGAYWSQYGPTSHKANATVYTLTEALLATRGCSNDVTLEVVYDSLRDTTPPLPPRDVTPPLSDYDKLVRIAKAAKEVRAALGSHTLEGPPEILGPLAPAWTNLINALNAFPV